MAIRRTFSVNRTALGWTLLGLLAASAPLPGQPRTRGEREPPDPLPPPLIAPVIVPPGEEPELAPRAGPVITFEERVLELVNEERLANGGLPPLKGVAELNTSSGTHSFNMADRDFFAHCDVDTKKSPFQRMTEAGYLWNAAAENIAAGQTDPEDVMTGPFGWMNSAGHRANILSTSYREIGIGYFLQANDQGNIRLDGNGDCTADGIFTSPLFRYWTQNFGRRNGVFPLVVNLESHDTVCAELQLYVYGPSNATQMRFSNDGVSFSPWEPYSPNRTWTIPGASGSPATVFSQVTNGSTTFSVDDEITLDSGFPAVVEVDLSAQTVNTAETFEACDTIAAGDGFEVGPSGDVTFRAGRRIVLRDGFSVGAGGSFTAAVDPTL
jgi:uncharacterized protein YkwD